MSGNSKKYGKSLERKAERNRLWGQVYTVGNAAAEFLKNVYGFRWSLESKDGLEDFLLQRANRFGLEKIILSANYIGGGRQQSRSLADLNRCAVIMEVDRDSIHAVAT